MSLRSSVDDTAEKLFFRSSTTDDWFAIDELAYDDCFGDDGGRYSLDGYFYFRLY